MTPSRKLLTRGLPVVGLSGALLAGLLSGSQASSHREAPLITEDPVADLTDVYAFRSPDRPDTVTLVANVNPFEEPAGGPNFHRFGDDVLYQINVDTNGDSLQDVSYDFRFSTSYRNPDTYLYNTNQVTSLDDPDLNVRQVYTVTEERQLTRMTSTVLGRDLPVAPANVGPRSMPDYPALAASAVRDLADGIRVFAGPRDDPFFVDLGSIFDLGGLRPLNPAHLIPLPEAEGVDYVAGKNVHTIAVQVPISRLVEPGGDPVIGVWGATYRRGTRVFTGGGPDRLEHLGPWIQVSRLGMPLVNEVVVPVGTKDVFNNTHPWNDAKFLPAVLNPELGGLIELLYPGVTVPKDVEAGLGPSVTGREDLVRVFLTGIPDVNMPRNVKPAEMLRLNTSTPVADQAFPNGRRLQDDVVDTELQVVAGNTAFTPDFNRAPNNALTDGVDANDLDMLGSFPYVPLPHQGY